MKATTDNVSAESVEFTPAMLAERKLTLADMPPSDYDHETQTRKFPDDERAPWLAPDTMFDGEKS
jgi:hypothetical protein